MIKLNEKQSKAIEALKGDKDKIRGYLLMEGNKDKDINEYLKANGLVRKMSNFRDVLFARLESGALSKEAFEAMLVTESANVKANKSHYWAIVEMANTVRANAAKSAKAA